MRASGRSLMLAVATCAVMFGSQGCFKHSYTTGSGGNVNGEAKYDHWHSHWLLGIIGEEQIDIKSVCPSGNATIKDRVSFVNGLIGALIGIVYYPTTVEVYCDGGKAASLSLSPAAMRKIAMDPAAAQHVAHMTPDKAAAFDQALGDLVSDAASGLRTAGQ